MLEMYPLLIPYFILFHDKLLISNLKLQLQDHIQNHNINSNICFTSKHVPRFFPPTIDSKHIKFQIDIKISINYPFIIIYFNYSIDK